MKGVLIAHCQASRAVCRLSAAAAVTSVVSDSERPHGLQPTQLLHPWDSPGKSTGVGCHRLLRQAEYIYVYIYNDAELINTSLFQVISEFTF